MPSFGPRGSGTGANDVGWAWVGPASSTILDSFVKAKTKNEGVIVLVQPSIRCHPVTGRPGTVCSPLNVFLVLPSASPVFVFEFRYGAYSVFQHHWLVLAELSM